MILKENNDSKLQRILNIDSLLDIQWWLYKSILSRQPLDVKYYKDWFALYKKSYETIEKIESNNITSFMAAREFKQLLSKLAEVKRTTADILSNDIKNNFENIICKISDGIENIISILEEDDDKRI